MGWNNFGRFGILIDIVNGFFISDLGDFYNPDINDPCNVLTGPNDHTIRYTDLREIILSCENPFDPNGETRLKIELGGVWPDGYPVDSFFDVFVSMPNDTPVGRFHIEIGTNIGQSGYWEDSNSGETVSALVELKPDFIMDGHAEGIDAHHIEAIAPVSLTEFTGIGDVESFKVYIESTIKDYRVFDEEPIIIHGSTEPLEFSLTRPWVCPTISLIPGGISGWGFGADKEVGIELDTEVIGTSTTNADGSFMWFIDPELELEAGTHAVIVKELDDSEPTGAAYATGYFIYCPEGPVAGDFDNDCDVDLSDFAIFANDWLKGTTLP